MIFNEIWNEALIKLIFVSQVSDPVKNEYSRSNSMLLSRNVFSHNCDVIWLLIFLYNSSA